MKSLHLIIVIFLGFIGLMLSYDNTAYGIWVRQSPQELIEQSSTIFVGNITSVNTLHLQKAQFYTMEENGTDKNFVRNYTLNLDEYSVDVEEFLKNPQNTNKITVRQPTIGLPTGLGALGGFKAGDRVLFYMKNLDGINEYSPESFVIPQFCIANDVLTQKRVEGSNNFTVIQNGIKVDYGNFTANTPIQFIYDRDVDTLYGKSFDVFVYITKNTGSSSDGIVFSKDIHAESKPCEWVASTEWGFTLGEGKYRMSITVKDSNSTDSESYTDFIVKPNVNMSNYVSPLKQFKSGVASKDVKCNQGLELLMKSRDNTPACVKFTSIQRLLEQGWINPYNFNGENIDKEAISLSAYQGVSNETFYNNGTVASDFTINVNINNFKPSNASLVLQVYYNDGTPYKTVTVSSDSIQSDGFYKYHLIVVSDKNHSAPFKVVATYNNESSITYAPVFAHP